MSQDDDKRAAALAAAGEVREGMLVGLGTGTTAAFLIDELGRRWKEDGLRFTAFATSLATRARALAHGIPIGRFAFFPRLDVAIDGVDEVDPALRAIKGGGGALLREKIIASSADRMVAIADGSKRVAHLGAAPLPVEVLPFARSFVAARLDALGGAPMLRRDEDGTFHTDQGNIILDCRFGGIADSAVLAHALSAIPGVMGHGLFLDEIDALYVADAGQVDQIERAVAHRT